MSAATTPSREEVASVFIPRSVLRELRLADGACGRGAHGCDQRWDQALAAVLAYEHEPSKAPAAESAGLKEALREAQFLCDRLDGLEWMDDEDGYKNVTRDYFGHVEPSHERLKALLLTLAPTEASPPSATAAADRETTDGR